MAAAQRCLQVYERSPEWCIDLVAVQADREGAIQHIDLIENIVTEEA